MEPVLPDDVTEFEKRILANKELASKIENAGPEDDLVDLDLDDLP